MCIVPSGEAAGPAPVYPAHLLDAQGRQELALAALSGQSISQLARQYQVSRKFVYQQQDKAQQALQQAFAAQDESAQDVLFYLPVTHSWLNQLVLALALTCHSPIRGTQEILHDLFDFHLSVGSIHNLLARAVPKARLVNDQEDLSPIRLGAHDEIFQNGLPVLVGVDTSSSYCYLLRQEKHRDGDTWAFHLLGLQERRFAPVAVVADGGTGLRAGHAVALPGVPCRADLFHDLRELTSLVRYLDNRAFCALEALDKVERRMAKAKGKAQGRNYSARLAAARQAFNRASQLAQDVGLLARWWHWDVLAVVGGSLEERRPLYDWLLEELRARQELCPHRIGPVVSLLQKDREGLLAFVGPLDEALAALAREHQVSEGVVREVLAVLEMPASGPRRWPRQARLQKELGRRWHPLSEAVKELRASVVRSSSLVENTNSRLRNYFFLRRQLGNGYLDLLRFYMNHRPYPRSERPERVTKSPAQLLRGKEHPHWLEMLGFTPFKRS